MESALRSGAGEPGLKLIETLRVGSTPARRALHRARMAAGAAALGWGFDAAGFDRAVQVDPAAGLRLRLTLDAGGRFEATQAALPAMRAEWGLALAGTRLLSSDPWLRIKSTRRAVYDTARAGMPEGVEELLFQNERGEVCDGTITTLFFDRGDGMRTPPLSSGLLPGVLRAELACPEQVLQADDLPRVRLWVGNALRGLIPAVWQGLPAREV
ncbi:aminotransferase class IV [Tabrizicola oligotrophica]|uniref:Probable branched-chain-amino-acid aminotransferase n=1 Tax=Tabrizicola oligotrophica TaxID=2710650 RepID=A0A6M0QS97_9RHOB|nr:aminotransferase class IV [Tabrizicola oligotrophica]NEY90389.1 aminotransferase class IV [Tabrizicola oligotrophica]